VTDNDPTIDPFTKKRYHLRELARAGTLLHYRLQVQGEGRIQSTDIVFTDEHTAIFGDLCPGNTGVCSTLGYGLAFFAKVRGKLYLAEKFLDTDWHQDLAHEGLDYLFKEEPERFKVADHDLFDESPEDIVRDLHGMIDDYDVRCFADWFTEHGFESEDIPGHGYKPRNLDLLSAINQRFAILYAELETP